MGECEHETSVHKRPVTACVDDCTQQAVYVDLMFSQSDLVKQTKPGLALAKIGSLSEERKRPMDDKQTPTRERKGHTCMVPSQGSAIMTDVLSSWPPYLPHIIYLIDERNRSKPYTHMGQIDKYVKKCRWKSHSL